MGRDGHTVVGCWRVHTWAECTVNHGSNHDFEPTGVVENVLRPAGDKRTKFVQTVNRSIGYKLVSEFQREHRTSWHSGICAGTGMCAKLLKMVCAKGKKKHENGLFELKEK